MVMISGYNGVKSVQQLGSNLEGFLRGGGYVMIDEGCDERNGSYEFEVHIDVREGRYVGQSPWMVVKSYTGGLNRNDDVWEFENQDEAIAFAMRLCA